MRLYRILNFLRLVGRFTAAILLLVALLLAASPLLPSYRAYVGLEFGGSWLSWGTTTYQWGFFGGQGSCSLEFIEDECENWDLARIAVHPYIGNRFTPPSSRFWRGIGWGTGTPAACVTRIETDHGGMGHTPGGTRVSVTRIPFYYPVTPVLCLSMLLLCWPKATPKALSAKQAFPVESRGITPL
jgi:hypothetical protein